MNVWVVYVTEDDEFDGRETFALVFDSPEKAMEESLCRVAAAIAAFGGDGCCNVTRWGKDGCCVSVYQDAYPNSYTVEVQKQEVL